MITALEMQASCQTVRRDACVACNLHRGQNHAGNPGITLQRPYRNLEDLPRSLRNELPELAQRMYLAVYQRVWETTAMGGESGEGELAGTAHEAALLEVERRFDKDDEGNWVQAPVDEDIDRSKIHGAAPDTAGD